MVIEWNRAEQLGLDGVVMHPGSYVESTPESGLERIAVAIQQIFDRVSPKQSWLLLENTAGQGTNLGWSMEQLGWLLKRTGEKIMVGVCLDTCHAHAAGYDFSTEEGFKGWEKEAKSQGVLAAIRALHLNDSKKGCGSRVGSPRAYRTRHNRRRGFRRVLKHKTLAKSPMYLETEKGTNEDDEQWDAINLRVLRELSA